MRNLTIDHVCQKGLPKRFGRLPKGLAKQLDSAVARIPGRLTVPDVFIRLGNSRVLVHTSTKQRQYPQNT